MEHACSQTLHHFDLCSVKERQRDHVPLPRLWQVFCPTCLWWCSGSSKSNKEDTQLCNIITEYHIKGLNARMCKLNSGSKVTDVPLNCNTRASASHLLEQLLYQNAASTTIRYASLHGISKQCQVKANSKKQVWGPSLYENRWYVNDSKH